MDAYKFLESKIGFFNSSHPFMEKDVDYEDIVNWLEEYAQQKALNIAAVSKCDGLQGRELLLAFINWYREDDMSKFSPEHLAEWFIKSQQ